MNSSDTDKKKFICIVNNVHGLLIYYLCNPQDFFYTLFVISDGISLDLQNKLNYTLRVPSFSRLPKPLCLLFRALYYFCANVYFKFKKDVTIVYGHDHLFYSQLFIKRAKSFTLLEDGLANYTQQSADRSNKIRKLLFGSSGPFFGWSDDVKQVVLSGIVETPPELMHKTILIDIHERWNAFTVEQKNSFLEIFSSEPYTPLAKVVIFTQPFSEDGMMSEDQKIGIYIKIYNHYRKFYRQEDICIKSHPRELTDYSQYFDCKFIKTKIPGQIMIMNDKPEILVTIYSSVGFVQGNVQSHIWGTKFDSFLLANVGLFEGNYNGWKNDEKNCNNTSS